MKQFFLAHKYVITFIVSGIVLALIVVDGRRMEQFFSSYKESIDFMGLVIAFFLIVVGWYVTANKTRELQKKQLSITILKDIRYQQTWVDARDMVFSKIMNPNIPDETWKDLAVRVASNKLSDGPNIELDVPNEKDFGGHLKFVLNTFEFVSMAIRIEAIDEYVIKHSWGYHYEKLYKYLKCYIDVIRINTKDNDLYANFTTLTEKWLDEQKGSPATPQ